MKKSVKLFITDGGDPSVGIFPCSWEIEVPFYVGDTEKYNYKREKESELKIFKDAICELYKDYCDGRLSAYFDFENTD